MSKCFTKRYNDCPAFFSGSLLDACQTAFDSTTEDDVRSFILTVKI